VVTAAALGDARGVPVVGVCSLDAVGAGERPVVTDARRREVYWARYGAAGERVDGPGVARPEGFEVPGPYVGDPAFADRLGAPVQETAVTTAGLLRAAVGQLDDPASAGPLTPLYLRRPDAVPPTASKAVTPA
jgi:tRNA A37 threonylcarbamoyladenosine modification protein TsaB